MAIVTICNDFRAQEEEICHCFHNFPFYLPWRDGIGCHDCSIFSWISRQLCHFHLSPSSKGLLVVILCSSAVAYWTTFDLDGSSFSATSLWLFMQFMGFSWQANWSELRTALRGRWLPRWLSGKEFAWQCRKHWRRGFNPSIGKIPWRRKW